MRRLLFLIFALILTACNARPPKTTTIPTVRSPAVELLIAPVSEASATPWLSDRASTIKAKIETKEASTPALSWYDESTPTPEIYMPKNIYSPTPNSSGSSQTCRVKGNTKSKIYHCQNSPNFSDLNDYRCFSSPSEAEAAGYRPSKNMSGCQY